jgi:hypothetical protein
MANTPATFKQHDLQRAIKAALNCGADLRVRVTKAGEIVVERAPDAKPEPALDATADFRL